MFGVFIGKLKTFPRYSMTPWGSTKWVLYYNLTPSFFFYLFICDEASYTYVQHATEQSTRVSFPSMSSEASVKVRDAELPFTILLPMALHFLHVAVISNYMRKCLW